ncbi:MAG: CRISPR-associated endonuclease Cas2 [bacterium]
MYYLIVYDIEEKRVNKVHKFLKKYMHWIQNSVFEGELTPATLVEVKMGLKKIIDKEMDSILIFKLGTEKYSGKEVIGYEKAPIDQFL